MNQRGYTDYANGRVGSSTFSFFRTVFAVAFQQSLEYGLLVLIYRLAFAGITRIPHLAAGETDQTHLYFVLGAEHISRSEFNRRKDRSLTETALRQWSLRVISATGRHVRNIVASTDRTGVGESF
jgi:hypothetical protein